MLATVIVLVVPTVVLVAFLAFLHREPYSARAIVFCLLLHKDGSLRAQQLAALDDLVSADVKSVMHQLVPAVDGLDARVRLPLVDIALPALAAMSPAQYREFIRALATLARIDGEIDLFEWTTWPNRNLRRRPVDSPR